MESKDVMIEAEDFRQETSTHEASINALFDVAAMDSSLDTTSFTTSIQTPSNAMAIDIDMAFGATSSDTSNSTQSSTYSQQQTSTIPTSTIENDTSSSITTSDVLSSTASSDVTAGVTPDRDIEETRKRSADTNLGTDETDEHNNKRIKYSKSKEDSILDNIKIENGKVGPYHPFEAEGRPRLAIYHPSFKEAEKTVHKICKTFLEEVSNLAAMGYSSEEINSICEILKKYLFVKDRYPGVAPVACLGPSGVGKSSTINSILHQVGVAYESDAGTRGTNLVHEFAMSTPNQTSMFEVIAPYLRQPQISTEVKKHLGNIVAYLGAAEGYEETGELEIDDLENKYGTAIEFFHILLRNHKEFSTAENTISYFKGNMDEDASDTIETLTGLIEQFKKNRKLRDGVECFTAESNKELAEVFRTVSRVAPSAARKPHPWPILIKIGVCHENDLLDAGLVIGDTPGIDDINQMVVQGTKHYLQKAGTVLVFTKFERGAINETLDANLLQCIGLGKTHDIRLIVTNIDGRKLKDEERGELDFADLAQLEEPEAVLKKLQMELAKVTEERDDAKRQRRWELFGELDDRLDQMPIKVEVAAAKVKQAVVELKCRGFQKEVKDKLRKLDRSRYAPDLPIHFVSNSQYQDHLAGYDAKKPPSLDIEGTGIPGIRRMLYEVPAYGKASTLSRIGRKLLLKSFHSIIGVLTKSKLERRNEVLKVVTDTMDKYTDIVEDLVKEISRHFNKNVVRVFDDKQDRWEKEADRLVDSWEKYKAQTFQAFCRKSGQWKVGAKQDRKKVSWNGLIQGIMVNDVQEGFQFFDEGLLTIVNHATTDVDELFRKLDTNLEECEAFQAATGGPEFIKTVHLIRDILLKDARIYRVLFQDMEAVRRLTLLDEDSYIEEIMQAAYENAILVPTNNVTTLPNGRRKKQKSTTHPARVEIIRQRIKGSATASVPSVFEAVRDKMTAAFEEKLSGWDTHKYSKKLREARDEVIAEFEHRFKVETEIKQEGDKEAIKTLKQAASNAMRDIEGPLKKHIDEFEAYEKYSG